jgi:SulP family sulfate permease
MKKPKLFSIIKHSKKELPVSQINKDVIAGIIVAIIALPLSVALAIASGVSPEKGLITAIIAGFLISFLGGSRVQIGGPTGAFVVIVYGIVEKYGMEGLAISTIMAGIILVVMGLMGFGILIKYIPYTVIVGFTSGIAVVLSSTQVKDFLGLEIDQVPSEFFEKWISYILNLNTTNITALIVGLASLFIIILWPKINKTIPGSLIALIVATFFVDFFNIPIDTIGSRFGEISSSLPTLNTYYVDFEVIKELMKPAITIALLAGVESLLSAVVADGMIGKKHNSDTELFAQGVANIASGLFGGIPATGAIARTAANVKNGGRTPIAGIVHSVVLLLIMLILMPYAKMVPMTTLAAILLVVSYNMSEWRVFKGLLRSTKSDIAVLLITFSFTVIFDLVVAIEVGVVLAMFLFVRKMSDNIKISSVAPCNNLGVSFWREEDEEKDDEKNEELFEKYSKNFENKLVIYEIEGPLFWGAADRLLDTINQVSTEKEFLILKLRYVSMIDSSSINVLKRIAERCNQNKIRLLFSNINEQPKRVMINTGFLDLVGKNNFFVDIEDALKYASSVLVLQK